MIGGVPAYDKVAETKRTYCGSENSFEVGKQANLVEGSDNYRYSLRMLFKPCLEATPTPRECGK